MPTELKEPTVEPIDLRVARAIGIEPYYKESLGVWFSRRYVGNVLAGIEPILRYSAFTDAAMDALERFCKERDRSYSIDRLIDSDSFIVTIKVHNLVLPDEVDSCCIGKTLPTAICAAILEAAKEPS